MLLKRSRILCSLSLAVALTGAAFGRDGQKSTLSPPEGAVLREASGEVKIKRDAFEVKVKDLAMEAEYGVFLADAKGALARIGSITTGDKGKGKIKFKDDEGFPLGVPASEQLGGRAIEVRDAEGETVLAGITPELEGGSVVEAETNAAGSEEKEKAKGCLESAGGGVAAYGEVKLELQSGDGKLEVKGKSLEVETTYAVVLESSRGERVEEVGRFVTNDRGEGKLKIEHGDGALPFGVASLGELAGYGISVRDAEGKEVLSGSVPQRGSETAQCGPPELKVEAKTGRNGDKLKIEAKRLDAGAGYDIVITNPESAEAVTLAATTDEDGKAKLELKTSDGDALPFGVDSVDALAGFRVDVVHRKGHVVLSGEISTRS